MPAAATPLLRRLGRQPYRPVWEGMRAFTEGRGADSRDEVWVVEHEPVFTLGLNGRHEHLLAPGEIPVVEVDRGGQVTYHGPGQLVVYPLVNLRGRGFGVRHAVSALEHTVIDLLAGYGLTARARSDAPGVYVPTAAGEAKVASLGLRIRRGCSYHGLSLNVAMDLTPFQRINPCGHPGMAVTQLRDLGIDDTPAQVEEKLLAALVRRFGYAGLESAPAPDWQAQESAHG